MLEADEIDVFADLKDILDKRAQYGQRNIHDRVLAEAYTKVLGEDLKELSVQHQALLRALLPQQQNEENLAEPWLAARGAKSVAETVNAAVQIQKREVVKIVKKSDLDVDPVVFEPVQRTVI